MVELKLNGFFCDGVSMTHTHHHSHRSLEMSPVNTRLPTTVISHSHSNSIHYYYTGVRIGPPPDLPSLLLHNRIVYIGMPLVPAVTELIIAELLYLNYESTTDPITMYINSSGTTTADGRSVGFETEAFAIADVMKYVRPPVHTVALGQAFGAAAMLLAQGKRGHRFALPNATILLNQPKSQARGQASDIAIKAREVAHNRRTTCELIASACGKPVQTVMDDCSRVKYLQPHEAVEYGLIDMVVENESLAVKPSFLSSL
jgi:ATP-dependent Clp protease protease subunit